MHRLLLLWVLSWCASALAAPSRLPNVVFILTDNQGAWTLGCYGNPDIRTPNIDRMASEGTLFTRALSSNPVCSPTRATFLTGLLPSQHGVHSFLDPKYQMGPEAYNTLRELRSLPEILRDAGYVCGMAGKWHLGDNLHPQEGFSYWVTMPAAKRIDNADVIENGAVRREKGDLTQFWTRHAIRFIEQNKYQPFFLYLPYNAPYALGSMLLEPTVNRHREYYADKELLSFPRDAMHPWQHDNKAYHNNIQAIRRVAAEISGIDDGVGEIIAALRRLKLEENTLVVFAGDQGWMGGQNGLWGMGDHTRPVSAFELMAHIPLIFWQPTRVRAGGRLNAIVNNYDFVPTVLGHLGLGAKRPAAPRLPGRDFSAMLRGESISWENVAFYEMEYVRSIRTENWKYVERPDGPEELYDMANDPFERMNLYGQKNTVKIQGELAQRLQSFFAEYADPKYDLWRGGQSKARIHAKR